MVANFFSISTFFFWLLRFFLISDSTFAFSTVLVSCESKKNKFSLFSFFVVARFGNIYLETKLLGIFFFP